MSNEMTAPSKAVEEGCRVEEGQGGGQVEGQETGGQEQETTGEEGELTEEAGGKARW